jgi:hypothetical protein
MNSNKEMAHFRRSSMTSSSNLQNQKESDGINNNA